jgi:imidazolonepropionase-like amidohydrolase
MLETIVLRNAFLIDGKGGEPLPGSTVVVSEGIIREVISDARGTKITKGRVFDLKGKTLMPGLIDAHVHAGNIEVVHEKTAALPPAVYVLRTMKNLETDLDLGFTTVRDAGGLDWGFRAAVDQGLIRSPRLLLSVSPLTQTGGHGDKRGPSREEHLPRNSVGIFPEVCDGPDEVRKAARQVLRRGADQIKVMADGGVASPSDQPGQWEFTVEELRAAVETAEAAGTYVMAHVYSSKAVHNCLEAGVRSIEHGNLLDAKAAGMMSKRGVYLVPTLTVYNVLAKYGREAGMDAFALEKLRAVCQGTQRGLELAYKAGVKIGSGSDIIGPFQYLKGKELALKAELMTPMEAIVSATRTNAELIGMSDRLGTVEPGKIADLIVLDGNPLEDPALFEDGLKRVLIVIKEGRIMKNMK